MQAESASSSPPAAGPSAGVVTSVEQVLAHIGALGHFQRILIAFLGMNVVLASALLFSTTVLAMAVPSFRCRIPDCDLPGSEANFQDADSRHFGNFSIPSGDSCSMFLKTAVGCQASSFNANVIVACNQFVFDKTYFVTTLPAELSLVCDQSWKVPMAQSLFFAGVMVAVFTFGRLSDTFGRRHVIMLAILLLGTVGISLSYVHTFAAFLVVSILVAMGEAGLFLIAFMLVMEMVSEEWRVFCSVAIEFFFVMGELLTAGLAYWLQDWRSAVFYSTLPYFAFVLFWPLLPESLHWLHSKGRTEQADRLIRRIALTNDSTRPVASIPRLRHPVCPATTQSSSSVSQHEAPESLSSVLRLPILRKRTFILCYTWLVITFGYYGLSLSSVSSLSGNPFLNFFCVSLVELPGYLFSYWCMQKKGRRHSMVSSLLLAGIALLLNALILLVTDSRNNSSFIIQLFTFLLGKFGLTSAFGTVYVFTSELYPTSIRTSVVGICSMFARIGAIMMPLLANVARRGPYIPVAVFGSTTLIAGFTNLLLPETKGQRLPQTVAAAVSLGASVQSNSSLNDDERRPLLTGQQRGAPHSITMNQ